ncbi:MAG: EAL domain-containing protein [Lachnospiraceae bacterium]
MNIQLQACGMLMLLLLYIFYRSHKKLGLYTEKIFCRTVQLTLLNLALDILSVILIASRDVLPTVLVNSECKLYIASLIWVSMSARCYVLIDALPRERHQRMMKKAVWAALLQSVIVFLFPIYIFADGDIVYTYGPATLVVYFFVFLNISGSLGTLCFIHKKMNERRVFAFALWMFIWIAAAVIQFFNKELLLVGFASAIGVMILFVVIENPEENIDRRLGCFSSYALSEYIRQQYREKHYGILEIAFATSDFMESRDAHAAGLLHRIFSVTVKSSELLAFKGYHFSVIILCSNTDKLRQAAAELETALQGEASLALLLHAESFPTANDLEHFLEFVHEETVRENRQTMVVADEFLAKYREKFEMKQKIIEALKEDRVEAFFQPIYSNHERRFTSAEALVRIRERDGSLLLPGKFIPVAEESGLILGLGERVFEKTCQFLKSTDAVRLGIQYIEINLSVIQCEQSDLAERLISIMEKYQVQAGYINLEITETASISARATLLENMKKLIEYGVSFSLDDFGKGKSNLMYVVEMPVSIVKLDYDIIKAFFCSEKAQHVVRAVIGMAHEMDLKLVAEGIEEKEEKDMMQQEGIDYIQGYYYEQPLPEKQFLKFLQEANTETEDR